MYERQLGLELGALYRSKLRSDAVDPLDQSSRPRHQRDYLWVVWRPFFSAPALAIG